MVLYKLVIVMIIIMRCVFCIFTFINNAMFSYGFILYTRRFEKVYNAAVCTELDYQRSIHIITIYIFQDDCNKTYVLIISTHQCNEF